MNSVTSTELNSIDMPYCRYSARRLSCTSLTMLPPLVRSSLLSATPCCSRSHNGSTDFEHLDAKPTLRPTFLELHQLLHLRPTFLELHQLLHIHTFGCFVSSFDFCLCGGLWPSSHSSPLPRGRQILEPKQLKKNVWRSWGGVGAGLGRSTNPNLRTRPGRTQQMDSSNIAGDWTQRTHDLAVDEPEPADSAWPNPADGLVEYSRRLDSANP